MRYHILIALGFITGIVFSQKIKLTGEIYVNPAFTKTWMPDRFYPPFSSSTYALIFGREHPDIGILGYNYGGSLGLIIKNKIELQLTFSKSLKGQRNSKDVNPLSRLIEFGMYTEHSDELTLAIKLLNQSLFSVKKFNYLIGIIISHYSLMTAGYYIKNNTIWNESLIQSRTDIFDPFFTKFRPGVTTEIEYQLLKDNHFTFITGLKLNHYFNSFNSNFHPSLGGRPRGYAITIGPSFKLHYQL